MSILSAPAGALVTLPEPPPPPPPLEPPPLVATMATITTTTATPRMIKRLFISGASYGRGRGRHRNMSESAGDGRDETEKERLDRNLNELLGELRVALPGVQVLFAFLLAVPFNQRFNQATDFEKGVYFVTLISTAIAAAFLIAPSATHRILFRADDKHHIVFRANRFSVIGFFVLGIAMTSAVLLVTHFIYANALAVATTIIVGVLLFGLWFAFPLARLRMLRSQTGEADRRDTAAPGGVARRAVR